MDEQSLALLAVPAGSPRFLEIGLYRSRPPIMHDRADVRLVHAHTVGARAYEDAVVGAHEPCLDGRALGLLEPGVVEAAVEA